MKINGFVADTSSLILLNKVELIDIFSSAFHISITKSVENELIIKNANFPLNNFKIYKKNETADKDIVELWQKEKSKALLSDDLKILGNAISKKKPYLSAIVVPYILKHHNLISNHLFESSINYLEKNGFYSKKIIKKSKTFLNNLPLWMQNLTPIIY